MPESTSPTGPLSGYRVLDLSTVIMGPLSTQILGDLGAEVITVEPFKPDGNRNMGDHAYPSLSGISLNILRNKRNVCADLKDPRIGLVTVTGVHVTPDLREAVVYVSVFGNEKKRDSTLVGLESAHGLLQSRVARQLKMKRTPQLRFEYDPTVERGVRMRAPIVV